MLSQTSAAYLAYGNSFLYGVNSLSDSFLIVDNRYFYSYNLFNCIISHRYQSHYYSFVYVLRTKCKIIYKNDFLFQNTCQHRRGECVCACVHD